MSGEAGRAPLRAWLTNAALVAVGCGLLLFTRQLMSEFFHYSIGYTGVSSWSLTLYAAAVFLILTQPVNRYTFGIILTVAIACRLVTLFPDPIMSSDIYRYAWDGVVQHAHISPYRYVPGDPALTFLREPNQDLFDHMNRRDYAHTIYPPAAQFLFYLITFFNGSVTFMKLAMILFEGLTMYALVQLLRELGIRREQALLYAWCPLIIWEIGSSGHLDSVAMAFIALALLARYRDRPAATGVFLGLAILTKLYPIVLLPALFRRGQYRMPAIIAALAAVGYTCYSSVGMRVFGFLGGYVQEEGMQSGERYFLLELAHHVPGLRALPAAAYTGFCVLVFAGITAWCWRTCCRPLGSRGELPAGGLIQRGAGSATGNYPGGEPRRLAFLVAAYTLGVVLMLLFSPHYAWYIAWLVPFFTLIPTLTGFAYIGGLFYLFTTPLAVGSGPKQFLMNQILYSTVLVAGCVELLLRRWPVHRILFPATATQLTSGTAVAGIEVER